MMTDDLATVFVSGCFDVIHAGHVRFFADARALGDRLIVCVPSDEVITRYAGRLPAMSFDDRVKVIGSFRMVDEVVVGSGDDCALNFEAPFRRIKPQILAVTEDDRWARRKRALCAEVGCRYVSLPKTLATGTSTSSIRARIMVPSEVPLRVDFAGGWLDVPRLARDAGYVVNMAISPLVGLQPWPYEKCSGLGGSAAWAMLQGEDPLQAEFAKGIGWQDPAIIGETGLVVWRSGPRPELVHKTDPAWLAGKIALLWTGKRHHTPSLASKRRDYDRIVEASRYAMCAVDGHGLTGLAEAVGLSYKVQLGEGMEPLPERGELAKKYCGGGHGGYAMYLFGDVVPEAQGLMPVTPYMK